MIVKKEDWNKLKEAIEDLYWEEDRMSSSGVETLNKIEKYIKKIEKVGG